METQVPEFIGDNNLEVDREVTFEVSKEVKVITRITFSRQELINYLIKEIDGLKLQVNELRNKRFLVTKESLVKLWDNEYDDKWNNC